MKMRAIILLGFLTVSVFAVPPHWVEIARPMSPDRGLTIVYLDDANLVAEGSFNGFNVKTVFQKAYQLREGLNLSAVITVFVIDCQTNKGKAKRIALIAEDGTVHPPPDTNWHIIEKPPATDTLEAVRQRVCLRASSNG